MRTILTGVFVAVWFSLWAIGCRAPTRPVASPSGSSSPVWMTKPSPVQIELASGLTVVLHENRTAPVVAVQAWVAGGSVAEDPKRAGLAHLVERVLAGKRSAVGAPGLRQRVAALGGRADAWTSADASVFEIVVASSHAERGVALLAAALANDHFEQAELDHERRAVLAEIARQEANVSLMLADTLRAIALDGRPSARPVVGTAKSVGAIDADHMRAFFKRHYALNNVTLVVTGDFHRARMVQALKRSWSRQGATSWRPKKLKPLSPQQSARAVVAVAPARSRSSGTEVKLAFRVPGLAHADAPAVRVMAVVLQQRVRDRFRSTGFGPRVRVSVEPAGGSGLLVVHATCRRADLNAVMRALADEAFAISRGTLLADDVALARAHVAADDAYSMDSVAGVAHRLATAMITLSDLSRWNTGDEKLRMVSVDDVRKMAELTLRPERATLAVATSASDHDVQEDALVALINGAAIAAKRTPKKEQAQVVVRHRLDNGMTLLIQRDTSARLVAMRAAWPGGLRVETRNNNGSTQLLARLLTRGTTSRSRAHLVREVERMSGSFAAFAGRDSLSLHLEVVSSHWSHALDLLADSVRNPAFAPAILEEQRRVALEQVHTDFGDWQTVAFRLFFENLYDKHPYRMPLVGETAALARVTQKSLRALHQRHYSLDKMTLAIVGDVDVERVLRKAKVLFAGKKSAAGFVRPVPRQTMRIRGSIKEVYTLAPTQQVHAVIGFSGATVDSPDRAALDVLVALVSRSKVVAAMRGDGGRVYRLEMFSVAGIDPGYVGVYIVASPTMFPGVFADLQKTLARLTDKSRSPGELARAKQYVIGSRAMSLRRRSDMASALALGNALGTDMGNMKKYRARVNAVDDDELKRVARAYLDWSRAVVAIVKPEELSPGAKGRAAGTRKRRPKR